LLGPSVFCVAQHFHCGRGNQGDPHDAARHRLEGLFVVA
jgi:hypothetical protein